MSFQLGDFILGHAIDVTAQRVREGRFHEVVHCVLDLDILSFQVATLAFGDSTLRLNKFGQSENGIDWQIYQSSRAGGLEILLHSVLRNIAGIGHRRSMLSALSSFALSVLIVDTLPSSFVAVVPSLPSSDVVVMVEPPLVRERANVFIPLEHLRCKPRCCDTGLRASVDY
jgi:hypothetical protein